MNNCQEHNRSLEGIVAWEKKNNDICSRTEITLQGIGLHNGTFSLKKHEARKKIVVTDLYEFQNKRSDAVVDLSEMVRFKNFDMRTRARRSTGDQCSKTAKSNDDESV